MTTNKTWSQLSHNCAEKSLPVTKFETGNRLKTLTVIVSTDNRQVVGSTPTLGSRILLNPATSIS